MPGQVELMIVILYAALNGLILLWLSLHVSRTRTRLKIMVGDKGNPEMIRAMRAQANFIEYVPFCLILLVLMAMAGAPDWLLHLFGFALTLGRLLHGLHFTRARASIVLRGLGAGLTLLVLALGSLGLLGHAIFNLV